MTERTVTQVIEDLAPYPNPEHATAENLARWFTAQAFASYCRTSRHACWQTEPEYDENGKPSGAYAAGLRTFNQTAELAWSQYAAAYLLRHAADQEGDMPLGDALRREVDSAELASECVSEWLSEYGIDAETIVQAVRAEQAQAVAR